MNTSRIIGGGLLAGLVINIGETILNTAVIAKDFEAVMQKLGITAAMGGATIGLFVVMCFLLGIFAVWLYAAVRPRLGAGPGTAIKVGLIIWALACVWPSIGMVALGIFPARLTMITLAWQLVEMTVAALAGAWAYKEETAGAAAAVA